jgi:hypothetical protein
MSDVERVIRESLDLAPVSTPAWLLNRVRRFVTRYVVLNENAAVAVSLWVVHAWVIAAFEATGYLEIRSPVRRCGKTTLLDVLELLVPRPWKTIAPSEAVFYRRISANTPTLLLDEVDAIFNRKAEATEGLRACLNAGNRRGTRVPRCVPPKMEIAEFEVFCAKALAGIGGLPATITDRSIPIEMRRRQSADKVQRFRVRKAAALAAPLVEKLEAWADDALPAVELELVRVEHLADDGQPLECLDDRAWEQAWEPLLAVASLAGTAWRDEAIAAAIALSGSRDDEMDEGVNLLADVRAVFNDNAGREALPTYELLEALLAIETSPWRAWWSEPRADDVKPSKAAPRKLARTLRPFGIRPVDVWIPSGATRKGYRLDDFRDAWARYLAPQAQDPRGTRHPASHGASGLADTEHEAARSAVYPRDPRVDTARPSLSRPPRGYRPSGEDDREVVPEWLAHDGVWRSFKTEPPAFLGEIIDTRYGRP